MSDHIPLSGEQRERLETALVETFSDAELRALLSYRFDGRVLASLLDGPLADHNIRVSALVGLFDRRGRIRRLVLAVRDARPDHPLVGSITYELLSADIMAADGLASTKCVLEKLVRKDGALLDVGRWAPRLMALLGQVCRISFPLPNGTREFGTGFLVDQDLVLTNHHVMEKVIDGSVGPDYVEVAFDYIDTSGSTAKEVTKVPLAPEGWLLASSPPSAEDLKPNGNGSATEFDYAVLRLKTRIGQSGILRAATTFASQRGWLHLPEVAQALLPGSDVIILQHPLSETLKLSLGRIPPSSAVARVRYDATTAGGSSGSVVLNSALEAVALHHCGDPTCAKYAKYNQGVLLDLVKMDLRYKGILL